ncbi:hypothetical protein AURDEDRAFT_123921 [Auricularia subglabra TFB-10046 SS5]|nr:hypothetical protein AURDEDRAFT_123921 [Auricularia subglabra TFB-10046 SS5]
MASGGQDRVVDDTDLSHISYSPPDAWTSLNDGVYTTFHNRTYHFTTLPGASIIFVFNGTYVAYYADLNTDHDAFSVQIDDNRPEMGNSYAAQWSGVPQLLFASTTLAPGPHSVKITNVGGPAMGLDSFVGSNFHHERKDR